MPMASVYYKITITATALIGRDTVEGAISEPSQVYVADPGTS